MPRRIPVPGSRRPASPALRRGLLCLLFLASAAAVPARAVEAPVCGKIASGDFSVLNALAGRPNAVAFDGREIRIGSSGSGALGLLGGKYRVEKQAKPSGEPLPEGATRYLIFDGHEKGGSPAGTLVLNRKDEVWSVGRTVVDCGALEPGRSLELLSETVSRVGGKSYFRRYDPIGVARGDRALTWTLHMDCKDVSVAIGTGKGDDRRVTVHEQLHGVGR